MFYTYKLPVSVARLPFVETYANYKVTVCPKLICLDGCNYVGKSTVLPKVQQFFESKGNKVLTLKQPFPQNLEFIKEQLLSCKGDVERGDHSNYYLQNKLAQTFRYDRRLMDEALNTPEAKEANIIVLDRGELSTLVCQQNSYRFTSIQPGLTLNLTAPMRVILQRFEARPSRGELDPSQIELSLRHSEFRSKTRALKESFGILPYAQVFDTVNAELAQVLDAIEGYYTLYNFDNSELKYPELNIKFK